MSMTESTVTTDQPAAKPAKAKKRHARANRRATPPPQKPSAPSALAGLTITDCADGCYKTGKCVITGSLCAHPGKGGLQVSLQAPETIKRFNEAKRMLGKRRLDLTEG